MAGEWIECALADACNSIDYGLTASASDREVGPRFLRITDIVTGHIDWKSVPHVATDDATAAKYQLHDGDIVLARTGASTGVSAYVKTPPQAVFASYLVRLQAKPEFDARFLAYCLRSDEFWQFIRSVLGDKSAQPNASASTMTKAPLRPPRDKAEQRAIANILGTLDDKIELNRRMNKTLEEMARAIFKSWFVDFDPVRAKAAVRREHPDWTNEQVSRAACPNLKPEIAALFPDRLVDSELGEIPEGWKVGRLGDVAEHPRRSVQPENIAPDTLYIALEHMPRHCIALSEHYGQVVLEYRAEVRGMQQRNLAVEMLRKLLEGEIKARSRKNVVQARSFAELLENAIKKYQNRAIETAQVIEELIALARDLREANQRGEKLGLTDEEVAFYDALEVNDSAVAVLGDETLRLIAQELVKAVRNRITIDWTVRENVRAQMRVIIKRILRKYGYPPNKQAHATELVLEQAEVLCKEWTEKA